MLGEFLEVSATRQRSFAAYSASGAGHGLYVPVSQGFRSRIKILRQLMTNPLSTPQNLGRSVNSPSNEFAPSISADGLSIFFDSDRPGGLGSFDIWVAMRATTSESFGTPQNFGAGINSSASDGECPVLGALTMQTQHAELKVIRERTPSKTSRQSRTKGHSARLSYAQCSSAWRWRRLQSRSPFMHPCLICAMCRAIWCQRRICRASSSERRPR